MLIGFILSRLIVKLCYVRVRGKIVYSKDTLVIILKCKLSGVFTICPVCSMRSLFLLLETQMLYYPLCTLGTGEPVVTWYSLFLRRLFFAQDHRGSEYACVAYH